MKTDKIERVEKLVNKIEKIVRRLEGKKEELVDSLRVDILNILAAYGISEEDGFPGNKIRDLVDELAELVEDYCEE